MKKLFFCAAALLAAISFAACSDDDATKLPITPDTIAGTWQITHEKEIEIIGDDKDSWSKNYPDEDGYYWTMTFDKNGSAIKTDYYPDEAPISRYYTYSISGNKITVKDFYPSTWVIKELTESQLVLSSNEGVLFVSYEVTDTYKRIQ